MPKASVVWPGRQKYLAASMVVTRRAVAPSIGSPLVTGRKLGEIAMSETAANVLRNLCFLRLAERSKQSGN